MSATTRFAALLVAILTAVSLAGGGLFFLIRISWRLGKIAEQFKSHLKDSDETKKDFEARLRTVEGRGRRRA